jgi:hypothetical protein
MSWVRDLEIMKLFIMLLSKSLFLAWYMWLGHVVRAGPHEEPLEVVC